MDIHIMERRLDHAHREISLNSDFTVAHNHEFLVRFDVHGVGPQQRIDAHAYWAIHQIARDAQQPISRRLEAAETLESLWNNVVKGGMPPKSEFNKTIVTLTTSQDEDLIAAGLKLKQLVDVVPPYAWGGNHNWVLDSCVVS